MRRLSLFLLALALLAPSSAGADPGQFTAFPNNSGPQGLTTGPDGNIWIAGSLMEQVVKMSPTGQVLGSYDLSSAPRNLTPGPDGNVWATLPGASKIARITPAGSVTEFPTSSPGAEPFDITAAADGRLWFTERAANRVSAMTTSGSVTASVNSPVPSPEGIAADSLGNIMYAMSSVGSESVGRILSQGGPVTSTSYSTGIAANSRPADIALGPDGNFWFTEFALPYDIGRITPAGSVTEFGSPEIDFSTPSEITAGPDGKMWFLGPNQGLVASIDMSGLITSYATFPNVAFGITAGPDGNVWASQYYGSSAILRILTGRTPTIRSAPEVTGIDDLVGTTLTAMPGEWNFLPTSYDYQWLRCSPGELLCREIPGANTSTYLTQPVDDGQGLRVTVTATNLNGPSTESSPTFPIDYPGNGLSLSRPSAQVSRTAVVIRSSITTESFGVLSRKVRVQGRDLCATTRTEISGRRQFTCQLGATFRNLLRKKSLRVEVSAGFTPTGGIPNSASASVLIPRKR